MPQLVIDPAENHWRRELIPAKRGVTIYVVAPNPLTGGVHWALAPNLSAIPSPSQPRTLFIKPGSIVYASNAVPAVGIDPGRHCNFVVFART
jgi:hypothetical protein